MSSSSRALVDTLIGAIPAEEGATLVARVGERARISSSAGSIDVGSVPLTAEVIDDLCAQLLAPEQLQALRETGTVQVEFTAANRAGDFAMLAGSTGADRWLEVRRRIRTAAISNSPVAAAAPPSEATMAAELLSRFHKESRSRTATAAPAATAVRPATGPQSTEAPAQSEIATATQAITAPPPATAPAPAPELTMTPTHVAEAPPQVVATAQPVESASGSTPDLDVPTNIDFPDSNFDLDDLSVPSEILDAPTTSSPVAAAERTRTQTEKPAKTAPQKRGARLSVLLPAAAVLVIGLPAVSWLAWTHYFVTGQAAPKAASPVVARPKPAPATNLPPVRAAATPAVPVSASPSAAAVAPSSVHSNVPLNAAPKAPAAPAAPIQTKSETPAPPPAQAKPAADTTRHEANPRSGFSVQVAAVHARDEADRMAAKLVQQGYSGYVVNGEGAAADFYRVRIGAFPDRQAAEDVAKRIELSEGVKPWIVKESR